MNNKEYADWDSGHDVIKPAMNDIQSRIDNALEFKSEQERVDFYKQIGRDEVIEEMEEWALTAKIVDWLCNKDGSHKKFYFNLSTEDIIKKYLDEITNQLKEKSQSIIKNNDLPHSE